MNATETIEDARTQRGLSLRAAAGAAGISEPRWRQVVKGDAAPDDTIARMALAVGLGPTDVDDPDRPGLPDLVAALAPAYEASVNMRYRLGAVGREAMAELDMPSYRDLAKAAGITKGVASGFLKGDPWPTAPELQSICRALRWDSQKVEELVWSGKDPDAITAPSLRIGHATWPEPAPSTGDGDRQWREQMEARVSRIEQALTDYLEDPTSAEAAQVLRRLQGPPAPPPHETFDLAADWPDRELRDGDEPQSGRDKR